MGSTIRGAVVVSVLFLLNSFGSGACVFNLFFLINDITAAAQLGLGSKELAEVPTLITNKASLA